MVFGSVTVMRLVHNQFEGFTDAMGRQELNRRWNRIGDRAIDGAVTRSAELPFLELLSYSPHDMWIVTIGF